MSSTALSGASGRSVFTPRGGYVIRNCFPIGEDTLAVLEKNSAGDSHVLMVDVKTGKVSKLHEETGDWSILRMCACDEGIVITTSGPSGVNSIDLLDSTGGTHTLFVTGDGDGEVRYTVVLGGKAYFGLVRGTQCSVNSVGINGGTKQVVAG